ncbi:MAG: DNA-binding protein [Rhodobacter sp.]|jgi:gp16 family phage-associated protein|nr:DNA-binding protein [Rhodobacter sp.]
MSKRTTEPVKRLRAEGKTVAEWAKDNDFPVNAVRSVIAGHNKGHYGQAHKIAVALGLKALPK